MAFEFAGRDVEAGERRWIELSVAENADGSAVSVPVCVVEGEQEGPTLWVQGCLHGSERVGGLALRDFLLELPPEAVSGTVIGVPVANPPAFAAKQRLSPHDGGDLNRSFPGSETGSFSERLAATLFEPAAEHADYFADLHNGGNEYVVPGFSIYSATGDDAEATARELCRAAGLPYAVGIDREFAGSMSGALAERGVPAVVVELGGRGHFSEADYEGNRRAIENVARETGVLAGAPDPEREPTFFDSLDWHHASHGGFFERSVGANTAVEAGQELARITSITGETKETFEAPYDGVVLCVRTYEVAGPGDWVIETAPRE